MKSILTWPVQLLTTCTLISITLADGGLTVRGFTVDACPPGPGVQRIQVLHADQGILHDLHIPTDGVKRSVLGPESELKYTYSKVGGECETADIDFDISQFEIVGTENVCTMYINRGEAMRSETFTSENGRVDVEKGTTLEAIDCSPAAPAPAVSRRDLMRPLPMPVRRDVNIEASPFYNATPESPSDNQQGCRDVEGAQRINFYTEDNKLYSLFVPKDGQIKWLEPAVWDCSYQIANGWGCGVCSRTKFVEFTLERPGSCFMRFHTSPGGAWLETRVTEGWWFMNGLYPGAVVCYEPGADGLPIDGADPITSIQTEQFPGDTRTHHIATASAPPSKRADSTPVLTPTTFITSLSLLPRATTTAGCTVDFDTTKTRQVNLISDEKVYQVYVPVDGKTYSLKDTKPDLQCLQDMAATEYENGKCGSCWRKIDHLQHAGDTPCKLKLAMNADGTDVMSLLISGGGYATSLTFTGWPLSIMCNLF